MKSKKIPGPCPAITLLLLLLFCSRVHAQNNQTAIPQAATVSAPPAVQSASVANFAMFSTTPDNTSSSSTSAAQPNDLPDSPQAPETVHATDASTGQQTQRILGIIPNFRSVSANVHLPPQTVKQKFFSATQDSFDYSSIFLPAAIAGYSQATNATPEFHQGAAGYGRYFWHSFVDQTSENYFVEAIIPSLTHEDSRYYTLGSGTFLKRAGYALSRAVITRNDAGHDTFNISEVVGAGAAAGVSNLYYPQRERTFSNTAGRWGQSVGIDAGTFLFHEFWPDIRHRLFHAD